MRAVLAGLAVALASASGLANEFCDVPGKVREHRAATEAAWETFKAKEMDQVEKHFGAMLAEHEAGRLSDAHLGRAFEIFTCSDAFCEPLILEWVRRYPRSPAAHLALAHHYAAVGFSSRGSEYASKTTDTQFFAMGEAFRKAFQALETADKYSKKPSLSASVRVWLGMASGGVRPRPTETYRAAIKAFPDTLQVRIRYIYGSVPKWGGSMAQLAAIVDEAKPLPPADRRYVEYLVLQRMAEAMQDARDKDDAKAPEHYKKAIEYYKQSVPLCPGLDAALRKLVGLQLAAKDFQGVLASAGESIKRDPRNGWAYMMRGRAYEGLEKYREAFADIEKATQLAHAPAHLHLAWHYEMGKGVARDYRKAIDHYAIAERHKVDGARGHADRVRKFAGIDMK